LYEEMAFIAHHFHWAHRDPMSLEHRERSPLVPGDLATTAP
jgi:hypothetical protein